MKRKIPFLLLCALLNGCGSSLPPAITRFEVQTPRPFGYIIGDEIRHRILINTRKDVRFDPNSIPTKGELNRWLNLNDVKVDTDQSSGDTVIELIYQVFYAPKEVKMLAVPANNLQFRQAGRTIEKVVPAWPFTISPLKELAVRKNDDGRNYLRPDAMPEPLSDHAQWLVFYVCLLIASFVGAYLAYLYGYFPAWPERRIFKQTQRQLNKLPASEPQQGVALIHRAFNQLYGQALFEHKLAAFYQAHPEYHTAAKQIAWFFNFSNRVLYGGQTQSSVEDWDKLQSLCRLCRQIECGSR